MTKSNNQNETDDYQRQMAEMKARMAKMQAQLDKMSAKKDGAKPKTHLAALPKQSNQKDQSAGPEEVLARANAEQASVLSESDRQNTKPTTNNSESQSNKSQSNQERSSRRVAQPSAAEPQVKESRSATNLRRESAATSDRHQTSSSPQQSMTPRASENGSGRASKKVRRPAAQPKRQANSVSPANSAARPASSQQSEGISATSPAQTKTPSAASRTQSRRSSQSAPASAQPQRSHQRVAQAPKMTFPGSTPAHRAQHAATSGATTHTAPSAAPVAKASQSSQQPQPTPNQSVANSGQPTNAVNGNQQQQMSAMNQDLNDLLAKVGMDQNDAKDLSQTYFYFISLIDNGKLVDQGRIITFNTKKMNHNGVVQGTNGEYYLDLEYLSKPHPRADALPLPKGYLVDLDEAKTIPDVETQDPSAVDEQDHHINLGGNTTVNIPESSKNSGYYIPLSKLNGGKIPVHQVRESLDSQTSENGSPHQAFIDHEPSQTMQLRTRRRPSSGETDIHFDRPASSASATTRQTAPSHRAQSQRPAHAEHGRREMRRESEHERTNKQHIGLGKALGTMFGFGSRR